MRAAKLLLISVGCAAVVLVAIPALAAKGNLAYGFNAKNITGFPTGAALLTGGGAFNPVTGFVHSAGGFRCTGDVNQGPLSRCLARQGVRWATAQPLAGTTFTCTGGATEPASAATT